MPSGPQFVSLAPTGRSANLTSAKVVLLSLFHRDVHSFPVQTPSERSLIVEWLRKAMCDRGKSGGGSMPQQS
jgi:hypothetical protein